MGAGQRSVGLSSSDLVIGPSAEYSSMGLLRDCPHHQLDQLAPKATLALKKSMQFKWRMRP